MDLHVLLQIVQSCSTVDCTYSAVVECCMILSYIDSLTLCYLYLSDHGLEVSDNSSFSQEYT